jgi:GGDEF domain-containing protein
VSYELPPGFAPAPPPADELPPGFQPAEVAATPPAKAPPFGTLSLVPSEPPALFDSPPDVGGPPALDAPAVPTAAIPGSLPTPGTDLGATPSRVGDLLRYRDVNAPIAPERAAEALKYSAATGGDPQWVADNLEAVKREVDASQVPWQQLWDDHPQLRPFLGDPVKAALIKDESTKLPTLMKWLGGWWMDDGGKLTTPFAEGSHYVWDAKLASLGVGIDEVRLAARKAADVNWVMRDLLEPWLNIGTGKSYSPPQVFAAENAAAKHELERSTSRDFDTNLAGKVVLAPFRMLPSLAGAAAVGAVASAAAPVEVAVGVGLGAKALWWAFQGYGSLYEGLGKIEGPERQKVDETSKQVVSALGSLAGGFAMEFGLRPVSKGLFGEAALTDAAKVTGEAAIANATLVQAFGRMAKEGGHALASGAAAMASQSAINEGAMQLGRGRAGMEPDAGAVVRASMDGFVTSLPDLLVLSFFGPARAEMKRRGEVVRAETAAQVLLKQGEAVRATKLRERFSGGLEELIRSGAAESGQETVYATVERFDQVAKAQGADPRSMAAAIVGDGGAAWDRAKQTGLALEIPVEKYLTRVAVNPALEKALLPDLRVDRDGRTLREVGEQQAKDRELMARVMAEPAPADDAAFDAVRKDFLAKALASGKVGPELAAANAENVARVYRYAELRDRPRALAAGEKPWTAWDMYTQLAPIEIAGWKDANHQVTSSGTALSPSSGRSALLEQALNGNPDAIRALDQIAWTDSLTGLGSMRAYLDFLTTQPARGGVHILVDLPGLGQVNNRFGQPVGNAYLADTARALHEASRAQNGKAYRGGGDEFTFHFDTAEAAAAFLAKGRGLVAALPEVAPGVKRSFYAGVGSSDVVAAGELNKAKKEAKAKHGDSKVNPQAIGHGEFFESRDLAGFKPVEGADVLVANLDGAAVTVDRAAQETLRQAPAAPGPVWYSALERAAEGAKQEKGTPESWTAVLSKTPGVKAEELEWTGLKDWLSQQKGTVTKAQVLEFTRAHQVEVSEKVLGGGDSVYDKHILGGEVPGSYKELLFRTPAAKDYHSPHFGADSTGLLAHARISEHLDAAGRPMLFIEEIQSDLHQTGREKGYQTGKAEEARAELAKLNKETFELQQAMQAKYGPAWWGKATDAERESSSRLNERGAELADQVDGVRVPNAPWKDTWEALVARRLLRYAAEHGYEKISWTTGAQQAERYKLEKYVTELLYRPPVTTPKPTLETITIRSDGPAWIASAEGMKDLRIGKGVESMRPAALHYAAKYMGEAWEQMSRDAGERGKFVAFDKEGNPVMAEGIPPEKIADYVGKENAQKLLARPLDETGAQHLHGVDFSTGGEGMKVAYDQRIPGIFKKLVGKEGGTLKQEPLSGETFETKDGFWGRPPTPKDGGQVQNLGPFKTVEEARTAASVATVWTATIPADLRSKVVREGVPLFQVGRGGDRGSVVFTPLEGGKGIKASIDLFQNADPSTLAHETAHVFGRLLELLATREGATEEVKADYAQMLKAMGYSTPEERAAAREERKTLDTTMSAVAGSPEHQQVQARLKELTAKEERLSYLWEQYLTEGKAPEAALAGTLGRFKNWLIKVYRSVGELRRTFATQYGHELGDLNPATRALFDRLLTAETEVGKATGEAGLEALPGAGPEVTRAFADARAEAEQKLLKALVEGDRKANSEMMAAERARLRDELAPEVDADPVQAAVRVLQAGGSAILKGPNGEPVKLNRKELTKAHGAEFSRGLAKEHPDIFAPKGEGMKLEDVAGLLGFGSGKELVDQLSATRNRDAVLEDRVQKAMNELYGPPLMADQASLAERAFEVAATPKAAAAIIKEMGRLAVDLADPAMDVRSRGVSWTAMVTAAETMIYRGRVADLSPGKSNAAVKAAGKRAFEAALKASEATTEANRKKWVQRAYEERDQQLWAMAVAQAAEGQKEKLDAKELALEKTGRTAWRAELGKADPVYLDAHDTILSAVGLGNIPPDTIGKRGGLEEALAKAVADAAAIDFDPQVIRQVINSRTPWRELSVTQAWEVANAVQNLRTMANNANELTILGKRYARLDIIAQMRAAAERSLPAQPTFPDSPRLDDTVRKSIRLAGQHVDQLLNDVLTNVEMLEGKDPGGIFHRVFIEERWAARDKRSELQRAFLERLTKEFEKSGLDRKRLTERIRVGDALALSDQLRTYRTSTEYTRADMLMMLLQLGNDSNEERFLGGRAWSRDQVMSVLEQHLNGKEARWVNAVWAALEGTNGGPSLYEEMARVHQERTGLRPEKIQAAPFKFEASDGEVVEMTGGYFPARYDNRPGSTKRTSEKQLMDSVSEFFGEGYQRESLKPYSPHAKARAEHYQDITSLDWGIVPQHVSQVIQDIAYRRFADQTAAIILDPGFRGLMDQRLGEERGKFFAPWLKAVVNGTSESIPAELAKSSRWWSHLKSNAAISAIGYSLPVAIGDLTQPLFGLAAGQIKSRYLAAATLACGPTRWRETRDFAVENFSSVRERGDQIGHKFREIMGDMGGAATFKNPILEGARRSAFVTMELTDKLTVTPFATARYQQSLAEGKTHAEAVRDVNLAVTKAFPAEDIADKPLILRSRAWAPFVMFYGFANRVWQVERMAVHDAWSTYHSDTATAGDKVGATARAAGTILAVSFVNGVMGEYLSGRGKDDDETTAEWTERKLLAALFYPVPVIGAFGDWAAGKFVAWRHDKDAPARRPSLRNAPALAYVQDTVNRINDAVTAAAGGDGDAGDAAVAAAETLVGGLVGVPVRQAEKTVRAASHMATGETVPAGPLEGLGNLIYGESDQANPLSDAQKVISQ